MTEQTSTVATPQDYGAGDSWAEPGSDYYVPEDVRPFYAAAEPSEVDKRGYIQSGAIITDPVKVTRTRLLSRGRDDGEPIVREEEEILPTLRNLSGAADYPLWLHLKRMVMAEWAKQRHEQQAAAEARWGTCQVCGQRSAGVHARYVRLDGRGPQVRVVGCSQDLPDLERAARDGLIEQAGARRAPDGRRVADVAAEVVAGLLAADGAA